MKQRGFTLIELAVVIAIVGVIILMALGFAVPLIETARRIETEEKINRAARAIAFYTVRNHRLPCPAEPDRGAANPPFGYERGSGAAGANVPADCGAGNANWVGIIPFNTVGLTEDEVTDGFGNPLTYAVSPAFALDTTDETLDVHPRCRTRDWFYQDGEDVGDLLPRDPVKARYCCPGEDEYATATDLAVLDAAGNAVLTSVREADESVTPPFTSMTGNAYDPAGQPYNTAPNSFVPPTDRVLAVNFVLVSHGANGRGAYILNGGGQRPGAPGGTLEEENHNGDRTFRDIVDADDLPAGEEYDDVTTWRTQDTILAENRDSCVVP